MINWPFGSRLQDEADGVGVAEELTADDIDEAADEAAEAANEGVFAAGDATGGLTGSGPGLATASAAHGPMAAIEKSSTAIFGVPVCFVLAPSIIRNITVCEFPTTVMGSPTTCFQSVEP